MNFNWILITVIIFILSFAGFIFYLWVNKLKIERIRHEEFTRQLLNSQERERKRLAAELHDGMGQNLLVIKNNALLLLKNPEIPEVLKDKLKSISDISSSTLNDVRSISHNLRPAELDRFGLTEAINSAIEKVQNSVEFILISYIENIDSLFENETEINIYRIVQESLNNVIKYSEATEAELKITRDASDIKITLTDNGRGFDVYNQNKQAGSGIRAISERINILNGWFDIASSPGKGTKLFITIPVNGTGFKLSKRTFKSSSQKSGDFKTNNLPSQSKSFIGREKELFEIKAKIKENNLLTIIGSGGTGKTSIAIQAGSDLLDEFEDGVWFVELAQVTDPSLIAQAIAAVFGLKETGKSKIEDILADYLKNKKFLLIIDNCEHLLQESSNIIKQFFKNCQSLKIISTSREPLNISCEVVYRIPPLPYPELKKRYKVKELLKFDSVLLFYDRAIKVREDYSISDFNAPSIAFICNKLDGIPLAIELAAARIDILTTENIAERLNDRFHLLKGKSNNILPRQKTLQAMIEWSYNLLNEKEKTLLCSLSIFSGGWKLKAAEDICAACDIKKNEILDLLDSLINKSLIVFDEDLYRYNMLETIKEYSRDKLTESGKYKEYMSGYLNYYMELGKTGKAGLEGNEQKEWLDTLETEHDNLQNAMEWSLKGGDIEKGARLAGDLGVFWEIRGLTSVGKLFLDRILNNKQKISETTLGNLLICSANVAINQGDLELAAKYAEESLHNIRKSGNKINIAGSIGRLGIVKFNQGSYEQAEKYFEESLALFREAGNKHGTASTLHNLGNALMSLRNYELAKKSYEESLMLKREIGDKSGISITLNSLCTLETRKGNIEQAKKYSEEGLALSREIGDKRGTVLTTANLAVHEINKGNYEQAIKYCEEGIVISREIGDKRLTSILLINIGSAEAGMRNYEKAIKYCEEALVICREVGNKTQIAQSLDTLGQLEVNIGNYDQAEKYFTESLMFYSETGDKKGIADSLNGFGYLMACKGNYEQAKKKYTESLKLYCENEDKKGMAILIANLGVLACDNGDYEHAAALLSASLNQPNYSGYTSETYNKEQIEERIAKLRGQLSDEEFNKYWEEGKKLSLKEAVDLALNL